MLAESRLPEIFAADARKDATVGTVNAVRPSARPLVLVEAAEMDGGIVTPSLFPTCEPQALYTACDSS